MTRFTTLSLSTLARRAALVAVLAASPAIALGASLKLSGEEEVPPVKTSATGTGEIMVKEDRTVGGSVSTTGLSGTMAHIHQGAKGKNGPPIITLEKGADGKWSVPAGAKLSDEQYKSYRAGDLYVNVHTEANKNGELRAQLMP